MAKVSKETKEMNEQWCNKQKEMKKTWSSYYIGGFIVALLLLSFIVFMILSNS
ncbi:MAG: hypothetical protein RR623_09375 [Bacilli bacterium]